MGGAKLASFAVLLLMELERLLSCQESGEAVDGAKSEAHDRLGKSEKERQRKQKQRQETRLLYRKSWQTSQPKTAK